MTPTGLIASIRQRLLNLAKERRESFDYVLLRYGVERFLYRLSVRIYQVYTVIAEKLEAIVTLDAQNSRMKDFFDLWTLLTPDGVDEGQLRTAIEATFACRKTALPKKLPMGLTQEFARDREAMWQAFLRKNALSDRVGPLADVVAVIDRHLPFEWE